MKFITKLGITLFTFFIFTANATEISEETSATIFTFCSSSDCQITVSNEPFEIISDGKYIDIGLTGKKGEVVTKHRLKGTKQNFYLLSLSDAIYLTVDENNNTKGIELTQFSWRYPHLRAECDVNKTPCQGKGFYWINLIGRNQSFVGEPYVVSLGNKTYKGTIEEHNFIHMPFNDPPNQPVTAILQLCNGINYELQISTKKHSSSFKALPQASSNSPENCTQSQLPSYQSANKNINDGLPILLSAWKEAGTSEEEKAALIENNKLLEYEKAAKANDDPLSWLGKLPATYSNKDIDKRIDNVFQAIRSDIANYKYDALKNFTCRSPSQVDNVAKLNDVNLFIEAALNDDVDEELWNKLLIAAKEGNWLARLNIAVTYSSAGYANYVQKTRNVQLLEWLQKRHVGGIYSLFGISAATGSNFTGWNEEDGSPVDIYAAMHDGYAAQHKVGKILINSNDPSKVEG